MNNYKYLDKLIYEIKDNSEFSHTSIYEYDSTYGNEMFKQVYDSFFNAVSYINKSYGMNLISIDNISVDIFKLILHSDQSVACFYLLSDQKYVFVFREISGQFAFFGRHKTYGDQSSNINRNFIQLLKVNCDSRDGQILTTDNTGNYISINEVIYQILKWLLF